MTTCRMRRGRRLLRRRLAHSAFMVLCSIIVAGAILAAGGCSSKRDEGAATLGSATSTPAPLVTTSTTTATVIDGEGTRVDSDALLAEAFAAQAMDLPVEGEGTVTRLLADDTEGDRHQRFIVELGSGQTLLVVHNIDVAPRVEGLREGDRVVFKGEYVWNEQGGLIHWTHHDPDGFSEGGWIQYEGTRYR